MGVYNVTAEFIKKQALETTLRSVKKIIPKETVSSKAQYDAPTSLSVLEKDDKDSEKEVYEDLEILMQSFSENKNKTHIDKIFTELVSLDEEKDRHELITQFNNYDDTTKREFAQLFFSPPGGALNPNREKKEEYIAKGTAKSTMKCNT